MKIIKIMLVIVGAVGVTALGIDAADTLRGAEGTLLSQVISSVPESECPSGMTRIVGLSDKRCVDIFEAGVGERCPVAEPLSIGDTNENLNTSACSAISGANVIPWRNVTRAQAETACARAGKRLPYK
jgi:hypothetical protein